jgi:hypothetical protein
MTEYGVGAGVAKGVIVLGAPPPSIDSNGTPIDSIIPTLAGMKTTAGAIVPPPSVNTVYGFLAPKATKEADGYYHAESAAMVPGTNLHVLYILDRQDDVTFVAPSDYLTWCDSHELVEVSSNPRSYYSGGGWYTDWIDVENEIGDLCNDIPVHETLGSMSYALTRVYSAKHASARDGDPCVPALPGAYANIALDPGHAVLPAGIGASTTVYLVPFSYGEAKRMHWNLYFDPSFAVAPSVGESLPGDDVAVTVTRKKNAPAKSTVFQVWVSDPAAPDSSIPTQEWIGSLR